ncbi:MAG: glycosyltransferase family 2 protein [Acidimicrobiales bacterium]|nr:glycosyltransferase family 2 protein [Acidimicrobiales bacterium]
MTSSAERVAAVIVNYNAGDYLVDCVRSLRAADVAHIVVADNASSDGSLAALRAVDPDVVVVETGGNFGYGGGVNRGATAVPAGVDVLLVCNPDLTIDPVAVKTMVAALDADPALGIVGPRIDNTDGTLYPSARIVPGPFDAVGHAFFGIVKPNNRFTRRYRMLDVDQSVARRVDWISGACFAIRRDLFARLGGFNEDYYMYLEEVDLCTRARAAGAAIGYEPAAQVVHVGGVSTRQLPYRMLAEHHRSVLRWWWSSNRGVKRVIAPLVVFALGVRFVLAVFVRLIRR